MTKVTNPERPVAPRVPKSDSQPVPPLPVASTDPSLQPTAQWIDKYLGNNDGMIEPNELDAFAAKYGAQSGYRDEIDALRRSLAQASPAPASPGSVQAPAADANAQAAAAITIAGGTGDASDVALVAAEVSKIPPAILQRAQAAGLKVVACRGSITDYCTELKGVCPRGWPPGSTWDQVPGVYEPGRHQVVVATDPSATPGGPRHVPVQGEGEGAYSLLMHEFAHGLDFNHALPGINSSSDAFVKAYEADRGNLTAHNESYLLQPGDAGHQEAFAESFGRFFAGDPSLKAELPNLYAYWQGVSAQYGGRNMSQTIGTARMLPDGTIVLNLRAQSPSGALGDSQLTYKKDNPQYQEILKHLGGLAPGESKPVAPWPD